MANKHMKPKFTLASLVIQIKTTLRFHLPLQNAVPKKQQAMLSRMGTKGNLDTLLLTV